MATGGRYCRRRLKHGERFEEMLIRLRALVQQAVFRDNRKGTMEVLS